MRPVKSDRCLFLSPVYHVIRRQEHRPARDVLNHRSPKRSLPAEPQDLVSIVHGTIKKIDKTTKAIVVKTADGTEHTIKVTEQVTVHGTKESFDDLKEGSEVVTRYRAN